MMTRRNLFAGIATAAGMALTGAPAAEAATKRTFLDIVRDPDAVTVFQGLDDPRALRRTHGGWDAAGVRVHIEAAKDARIALLAPRVHVTQLHVRWHMPVSSDLFVLGDAWERSTAICRGNRSLRSALCRGISSRRMEPRSTDTA